MTDHADSDTPTRQSSRLSLGSSPSLLSTDEQMDDADGSLTPTERIADEDDLFGSAIHADSPEPLSNTPSDEEVNDFDLQTEQDSASPLSSVPDDFPLSRPLSPEEDLASPPPLSAEKESTRKTREKEVKDKRSSNRVSFSARQQADKHDTSDEEDEASTQEETPQEEKDTTEETPSRKGKKRKRRSPRTQAAEVRTRRRLSRQEPPIDDKEGAPLEREAIASPEEKSPKSKSTSKLDTDTDKSNDVTKDKETQSEVPTSTVEPDHIGEGNLELAGHGVTMVENNQDDQQRHKDALEALTHIEVEFARLRDKMYQEKMAELNREAHMIADGTHPDLTALMSEIEEKKKRRMRFAEAWRRHQHANYRQQFEGFEYQANVHFMSKKYQLRRDIMNSVHGKRWALDYERTRLNNASHRLYPDGTALLQRKRLQKEESGELQDIKETVGFPMAPKASGLSLHDIDEDLAVLGLQGDKPHNGS